MFYIGYHDEDYAQIGLARSRDGISNWERHGSNPIISPDLNNWDGDACYKPVAVYDGEQWLLWYNGRKNDLEQIGLAVLRDRKSTRLNSSHVAISYAVFCVKKRRSSRGRGC